MKEFENSLDNQFKGMTLNEVGEEMGISRERVRQIEERALRKLKFELIRRGILHTKDVL